MIVIGVLMINADDDDECGSVWGGVRNLYVTNIQILMYDPARIGL